MTRPSSRRDGGPDVGGDRGPDLKNGATEPTEETEEDEFLGKNRSSFVFSVSTLAPLLRFLRSGTSIVLQLVLLGSMTTPSAPIRRSEFPILETCTYLVSHSLGAMPRSAGGQRAGVCRHLDDARRAGLVGGLVGDRADDRRPARADHRGCSPGSISMHQNATVAQGIIGVVLSLRRAAAEDRPDRVSSSRPTSTCSKAFAATARTSSYVPGAGRDPDRPRAAARRRSTSTRSWCRCRWCCSAAATSRTPAR